MVVVSKFSNSPNKLSKNDELRECKLSGSDCMFPIQSDLLNSNSLKTVWVTYSQTHLIQTLLIHHFCLIHWGNLKTLKPLPLTPMLNQPFN